MQCLNGKVIKTEDGECMGGEIRTVLIGEPQKVILTPRVEIHRVIKSNNATTTTSNTSGTTTSNAHDPHHDNPQIIFRTATPPPASLSLLPPPLPPSDLQVRVAAPTTTITNHAQHHTTLSPQRVQVIKDGRFYEEPRQHNQTNSNSNGYNGGNQLQQQSAHSAYKENIQQHGHSAICPDSRAGGKYLGSTAASGVQQRSTNVIATVNDLSASGGGAGQNFRTPVVSSSSTPMRPPPPPPPKLKGSPTEEPSSSIPDLEFDGTTVLCRVCGDKASGFHYGVHSCEGCKGFFRRSIQQKIQYRPCTKNQQCSILRINRNRCQYCRLKKCIAVGMSRDAVRFGRVPKREKARILAAMQQSTQNRGQQRALATELDDQPRLLNAVLRAHMDTCEFTREKVSDMRRRARDCPTYSMPTLACPLNPAPELQSEQEFSQRFAHVIRGVIDFAGMIPGFQLLTQDDKFTLLKAGLFDALFVRLICMFDSSINSIICLNGQVMRRDSIQNGANARFLVDSTFNFAERMNAMNLTDAEIGLFCAIVLITPDRPGLRNLELIEKMYTRLKACLQSVINQNRPNQPEFLSELLNTLPDLRTLSTLHTEKLVVFRTEHKELLRQQMWTGDDDDGASTKSPGSSTWGCENVTMEDVAKSPMGSVSSTESSDTVSEFQSMSTSAPLLAATLSGGCPLRMRANSGSSADDDIVGAAAAHLTQNGLTITPVVRTANGNVIPSSIVNGHHNHHHHIRYRKLDSPTDSGIESGNEKADHKVASSGSSSCSSPRSSVEDASEDKRHIVEDMPVLKRVLQAPPLYDTNSLMDEAYKPHKKFRALRHRDSCGSTTSSTSSGHQVSSNENSAEAEPMQIHLSNNNNNNNNNNNQYNNNNNNNGMFHPVAGVMLGQTTPSSQTQSQLHMHLTRPQHSHNHTQSPSSLSSTHSVLAKSLMEEPRMTPEQMKRSDIIQNYIMRESAAEHLAGLAANSMHGMCPYKPSASTITQQQGLLVCAAATSTPNQTPSPKPPQTPPTVLSGALHSSSSSSSSSPSLASSCPFSGTARWSAAVSASVITATSTSTPSPPPTQQPTITVIPAAAAAAASSSSSRYFQSPHSTSSSLTAVSQSPSPRLLELQVEIANAGDGQQPLNLSKKSPSPTPPPPPTSSSTLTSASSSSGLTITQQQVRTLPATAGTTTIHKVLLEA